MGPAPRKDRPGANQTLTRPPKAALDNPDASGHPARTTRISSEGSENSKTRSDRHDFLVETKARPCCSGGELEVAVTGQLWEQLEIEREENP